MAGAARSGFDLAGLSERCHRSGAGGTVPTRARGYDRLSAAVTRIGGEARHSAQPVPGSTRHVQRNDKHWTLEEQLAGRQTPTQLGRVLQELGIEAIRALSPQAKGRIERLWKTFQNRLKSELRLRGVCGCEQGDAVLASFIEDYNRRFAVNPREAANDYRPLRRKVNRERLFSLQYERTVGKDHVIQFGARAIQLPARRGRFGYAGLKVELSPQLNGELHVWYGDERLHKMELPLDYTPGQAPPRPAVRSKKQSRIYVFAGRPAVGVR